MLTVFMAFCIMVHGCSPSAMCSEAARPLAAPDIVSPGRGLLPAHPIVACQSVNRSVGRSVWSSVSDSSGTCNVVAPVPAADHGTQFRAARGCKGAVRVGARIIMLAYRREGSITRARAHTHTMNNSAFAGGSHALACVRGVRNVKHVADGDPG